MGLIFRALGVEGSGQFGYAMQYTSLFTVFATLGIQRLLVRDIARDPSISWTYVWTATGVMAFLSALVTIAIGVSIFMIESNPIIRAAVMTASISVVIFWALQSPFEALLMARERMVLLAGVNLLSGFARLVFTYYALRVAPTSVMAYTGIAMGNAIAFVFCIACSIFVAGWERPRFRPGLAWAQIRESAPFTVAVFLSLIYFKSDMSLLKWMKGEHETGLYTVAQRLMEPVLMIAGIWGTAVFPALCRFSVTAPDNYSKLMNTSARLALMVAFPMAFGISALAHPIIVLLTGARAVEFQESELVLQILCGMIPLFYLNGVAQEFLYSRHYNWHVVYSYAVASVISVAGNLLLIPRFGAQGVCFVAIAANLAISAMFVYGMRKEYGAMRLPSLTFKTIFACTVMAAATHALSERSLIASIMAGGIIYVLIQTVLRTLSPDERGIFTSLLNAVFRVIQKRFA
jgi:O-antigen/teichoic acid export membrane protein